jgi:hypothetical protein
MNTNNTSSDKDCEKWIDIDHIPPPSKPLSAISLTPSIERLPAEEKGEGRRLPRYLSMVSNTFF